VKAAAPVLLVALLAAAACRTGSDSRTRQIYQVEKHYQNGPVALTLKVSQQQITVADHIELVLEARAGESDKVQFPAPAADNKLGKFTVTRTRSGEPRLVEDNQVLRSQIYELEPFLPGDYEIPALTIRFGAGQVIQTDPVPVRVVSVLPDSSRLPDIKEIAPPVALPRLAPWIYGAVLVALAAAGFWFWRRRRKQREKPATPAPPHERALRELRKLMEEDLISKGEAKLFYLRVSAILRHYIEERFGLRAPERTTEEFLRDLRGDRALNPRQKELLKQFLEHCDLVKFANYQPRREEVNNTVNTCAQFIAETRPGTPEQPSGPAASVGASSQGQGES